MTKAKLTLNNQRIEHDKQWQKRHDERFGNYTEKDWEQEFQMQREEVIRMTMRGL